MTGPYVPSVESPKMATPLVGGTFANQDSRSINQGKPPPEFDQLVDTGKINMDVVMKSWIATRGTELLACTSESLVSFISSFLEDKIVDAKSCQIKLTEFVKNNSTKCVEEDTVKFVKELWNLIAQHQLLNLEKAEIHQNKTEDDDSSRPYADPVRSPLNSPNIPDGESELNSNHSSTTKNWIISQHDGFTMDVIFFS